MKIYRACCHIEYLKHIKNGRPPTDKRCLFFSHDIKFIRNRVQDGAFNNSAYKTDRYTHIVCYDISGKHLEYFVALNKFEMMIDRRNIQMIKWTIKEVE